MSLNEIKRCNNVLETQVSICLCGEVDFRRSLKNEIEAAMDKAEGDFRQREREERRRCWGKAWP